MSEEAYAAFATILEQKLCQIWESKWKLFSCLAMFHIAFFFSFILYRSQFHALQILINEGHKFTWSCLSFMETSTSPFSCWIQIMWAVLSRTRQTIIIPGFSSGFLAVIRLCNPSSFLTLPCAFIGFGFILQMEKLREQLEQGPIISPWQEEHVHPEHPWTGTFLPTRKKPMGMSKMLFAISSSNLV